MGGWKSRALVVVGRNWKSRTLKVNRLCQTRKRGWKSSRTLISAERTNVVGVLIKLVGVLILIGPYVEDMGWKSRALVPVVRNWKSRALEPSDRMLLFVATFLQSKFLSCSLIHLLQKKK